MKKSVIIYYSNSGTTATLARKIKAEFGSKVIRVEPDQPYGGYLAAVKRAGIERKNGTIAPYTAPKADLSDVDVVFVGYPIWYSDAPAFLLDYLSKQDLKGKTVIPFSTAGANNIKCTLPKLKTAVKGAVLAHPYNYTKFSKDNFEQWADVVCKKEGLQKSE